MRARQGEHEQVTLRILYTLGLFLCAAYQVRAGHLDLMPYHVFQFAGSYLVYSTVLLLILLWDARPSRLRLWLSMVSDIVAITYVMAFLNDFGILLFWIYLWVIVGNGTRYGIRSLLGSYLLSLLGFGLVILYNPFWSYQPFLAVGLLLTLALIPLHLLKLLGQLHQAVNRADKASKAKSRFLAHMSHEMRTPLNGVIGVSDLLTTTELDTEQQELVGALRISAQTLLQLIENVLDFSRIESGKLASEQMDFDLHQLVHGTLAMFTPQARIKGLRLIPRFSANAPFLLKGDALHLRQILINLLGNALKFTEHGHVELCIQLQKQDQLQVRLRFEINDTGIGIEAAALSTVFESFTQAGPHISSQYGGSGLGTTISRQLARLMGGDMGATSTPGQGSTFWLEIPLLKQSAPQIQEPTVEFKALNLVTLGLDSEQRALIDPSLRSWGLSFQHELAPRHYFDRLTAFPKSIASSI